MIPRWSSVGGRLGLWASIVLGALALGSGIALAGVSAWLITRASEHPHVLAVAVAVVGVRFFGIARPVLRYVERLTGHRSAFALLAAERARIFDALIPLTPARLGGARRHQALGAVVEDVDALVDRMLRVRAPAAVAAIVCSAAIGAQSAMLPAAGIVLAAAVVVAAVAAPAISAWSAAASQRGVARGRAELSVDIAQVLASPEELIAAGAVPSALARLSSRDGAIAAAKARGALADGIGAGLSTASLSLAVAASAAVAIAPLREGRISAPLFAVIVLLPLALAEAVGPLTEAATIAIRVRESRRRLRDLMAAVPAVAPPSAGRAPTSALEGPVHLELRGMGARWDADGPLAVRGIDVDLPPGRTLAIVGRSGSGKSTIAAVLLRFLDPAEGTYLINGIDVRELDPDAVRAVVGLVDDSPYLFATSLVENVRLARPGASDEQVEAALRRARLGQWLDDLPRGLRTLLGDGGAAVSGGERARIALARAFLADQRVLVLDEPTAALDRDAAQALMSDILEAGSDRAIVLITHRDEGLDLVDGILELDGAALSR